MDSLNDDSSERINRCDAAQRTKGANRFSRLTFFRGGRGGAPGLHQGKLICRQLSWSKKGELFILNNSPFFCDIFAYIFT